MHLAGHRWYSTSEGSGSVTSKLTTHLKQVDSDFLKWHTEVRVILDANRGCQAKTVPQRCIPVLVDQSSRIAFR